MVVDSEWEIPDNAKCHCEECGAPLYDGDYAFLIDKMIICDECLRDYMKENYRYRVGE